MRNIFIGITIGCVACFILHVAICPSSTLNPKRVTNTDRIDPRTGGKIISEHEGYLDGNYVWQKTVELPDDYIDSNWSKNLMPVEYDTIYASPDSVEFLQRTSDDTTFVICDSANPRSFRRIYLPTKELKN